MEMQFSRSSALTYAEAAHQNRWKSVSVFGVNTLNMLNISPVLYNTDYSQIMPLLDSIQL